MKKLLSIVLCILWMGFIFYNSSQSGTDSNGFTYKIVDKIITISEQIQEKDSQNIKVYAAPKQIKTSMGMTISMNSLIEKIASKDRVTLNKALRKGAHAVEFLILAILLSNAFFCWGLKGRKIIIYILFLVLFSAVLDEYHQIYVIGRGSSVKDVLIDFAGGIIGIIIYYASYYSIGKIKKRV